MEPPRLILTMLGDTRIDIDHQPVACSSRKALGLFHYLALREGRHTRRELARLFWSADEDAARTSLRKALQRLPASLVPWLTIERDSIALRADEDAAPVLLDTARFAALAKSDDLAALSEASQLYGGDLLKDIELDATPEFDDWLHRERTRFRQLAQGVFDRLIARHRERAHLDSAHASAEREAAMAAARRWTTLEPAAERAHRWLMRLSFETGQREAALAQFELCRRELAVALGRGPDAETRALFDAITAGGPEAGAGSGSAHQHAPASSSDPMQRAPEIAGTSFVGRIDELATLDQLLGDPACRLLTLHALGGMGKSRLAYALANQVASRYAFGATWIALEPVLEADQLPHAVAAALGFVLPPQFEPRVALCEALRAQERLLVLDNFEHLIAGQATDLVLAILRAAPRVRLLVTSREVLGVQEEWVYEVPGLAYPRAEATRPPGPGEFPAVELFMQRARQAYLGFSPQAEWPHVVRICRLVEGLPLALELAAAWVRTIPCADLAQAIENEMASLDTRHRDRPARQQSLDAVVRTSWALLTSEQQYALASLSVFAEGFTNEAAEAVADATLRLLSTLVDKSLVSRRADGRFGLHALIRRFLHAQLESMADAHRETERRFATHVAAQLERWRARLDGPNEVEAESVLATELPNLLAASVLWLEQSDGLLDRAAEPLLRVLIGRGLMRQTLSAASRILAAKGKLSPATRSLALAYRGRACLMLGDLAASRADFDAAIDLARQHDLAYPLAYALLYAEGVAYVSNQLEVARGQLEELELLIARLDDPLLTLRARFTAGRRLEAACCLTEAEQQFRLASACATRLNSLGSIAMVQASLAAPLIKQGRFDEGAALLVESLVHFERIGSANSIAPVLNSLAMVKLWRSNGAEAAEAAADAARACELMERVGYAAGRSVALDTLGQAMSALGRTDEARRHFESAAALGPPILQAEAQFHLGWLDLAEGKVEAATAVATALVELAGSTRLEAVERCAQLLTAALALRRPDWQAPARRWLRGLLGDAELDFDLRRRSEALLMGAPTSEAAAGFAVEGDRLSELRAFLVQ